MEEERMKGRAVDQGTLEAEGWKLVMAGITDRYLIFEKEDRRIVLNRNLGVIEGEYTYIPPKSSTKDVS